MTLRLTRRAAVLSAIGLLLLGGGAALFLRLKRDVGRALGASTRATAPLAYLPLPEPKLKVERWGGGETEGVALGPTGPLSAGAFGVMEGGASISDSLPTLQATALALWRGQPAVGLAEGGLFLRRDGAWLELRSGFGPLHVRALLESPGGELLIGAREGLFRAAWGAASLERLDTASVRALALDEAGHLVAGGEQGLRLVEAGRVRALASPDPWIDWVGLQDGQLTVLTAQGLVRGPLDGALAPLAGGEEIASAAQAGGQLWALAGDRLLRFDALGRPTEEFLPSRPRKLLADGGQLFADTERGLYRRGPEGWSLARPRPASLPGSSHVGALAYLDSRLVVGLFSQGLVIGDPRKADWSPVEGSAAWGVNALLPAGGGLYVASLRGAARFDGRRLSPLGQEGGAAFSLAATEGGVAVGYGQGVALPDSRFLSAFHGLPGNQALALASGAVLFVGTPTGLGAIRGSRVAWRVTSGDGRLPHPWVTALDLFGGELFVGTYGGGVTKRRAPAGDPGAMGSFQPFAETEGLKVNQGCLVEAAGRLYLGTDGRGLYRLSADGQRFEPLRLPLPSPHVTAILPAKDGLFVGTDEGLARIPLPLPDEGA